MLEISANRGAGAAAEDVRKLCASQADEVRKELRFPPEYRLTWLRESAEPK